LLYRLIDSEKIVLSNQGKVVRLAGLYNLFRGAHMYWLKLAKEGKPIPNTNNNSNRNSLINLIHYEDAADCVLSILTRSKRDGKEEGKESQSRQVFLANDDCPMTREEICRVALESKHFHGYPAPRVSRNVIC
jgi:nucleoside-diphosphate-sugar epimerase